MRHAWVFLTLILGLCLPAAVRAETTRQPGGELHFCLHGEPKTFNPLLVEEDASETIRYLTGGVLIRLNRQTQALEPGLAVSWKVSQEGRRISFHLRSGLRFSDGTSFTAEDVAYTIKALMDPQLHSPTGDSFRSGEGQVDVQIPSADTVVVTFPAPVAGLERLFDQVAILSAHSPKKEMAVLGPFYVTDYSPGSSVLLHRNPNYWKKDKEGKPLPYLDSIRLDIQRNRDIELLRFRRGEIQLINALDSESFDSLQKEMPAVVHDAGPGLDSEQMWFNQVPSAPLSEYKKNWFRTTEFRKAISMASIAQICAASSLVDTLIRPWGLFRQQTSFGSTLRFLFPHTMPREHFAACAGRFPFEGGTLHDSLGKRVEFTVITNAGNKSANKWSP
jgi:peptide/nickel transport system substrate-binding protein